MSLATKIKQSTTFIKFKLKIFYEKLKKSAILKKVDLFIQNKKIYISTLNLCQKFTMKPIKKISSENNLSINSNHEILTIKSNKKAHVCNVMFGCLAMSESEIGSTKSKSFYLFVTIFTEKQIKKQKQIKQFRNFQRPFS